MFGSTYDPNNDQKSSGDVKNAMLQELAAHADI